MLTYHPGFDPYHCSFRMLQIMSLRGDAAIELERLFVLDFYLLFPDRIASIRLPREFGLWRSNFASYQNPYFFNGDNRTAFSLIHPFQSLAASVLASKNLFDGKKYLQGQAKLVAGSISTVLRRVISQRNEQSEVQLNFLIDMDRTFPLRGSDGLKARTGLMEFHYDPHPNDDLSSPIDGHN